MSKIHMILQGKGGVGKSLAAILLAQYYQHNKRPTLCIDADPVNTSFLGFKALNVQALELMENNEIDSRKFDKLVEIILPSSVDMIVDNGASSFTQISRYLLENDIDKMLNDASASLPSI